MQKDTVSELELNQKKRARRRLVGAIALVVLMIILLPLVLKDRNASAPKSEITITLPKEKISAPSDFDSTVTPAEVAPQAAASSEAISIELPQQAREDVALPTKQAPVAPDKDLIAVPNSVKAAGNDKAVTKEAVVTKEATPKKVVEKPVADKPNTGKFYVQVGVFSDEANVKLLQTKLRDLGYQSQTEIIDTSKGKKIRLHTQVLGDRNDAAIALENIKDAGLAGMVVSQ